MLTVEEINEFLRKTLREDRKIIRTAKLPGTVTLQFIKSDSKHLTINTISKIAEYADTELVVGFRDKTTGEIIPYAEVEKRMKDKANAENKKHQETEKLIAGVDPADIIPTDDIKALAESDIDLNDLDPEVAKDVRDYRREQEENDRRLQEFIKSATTDIPPSEDEQFDLDFGEVFEDPKFRSRK